MAVFGNYVYMAMLYVFLSLVAMECPFFGGPSHDVSPDPNGVEWILG